MFWNQDEEAPAPYQVPDDVFDLVFRLRGTDLDIDHAFALSTALQAHLSDQVCARIGVHGVRMAGSGNGWNRPEQSDAALPLSRRARLAIRVHRGDSEAVGQIMNRTLRVGHQQVTLGSSEIRKLSTIGTLYSRAICCNIKVSKMICGRSGEIRTAGESIFTRALMVADLEPEESV
jgi:hypothetical protein